MNGVERGASPTRRQPPKIRRPAPVPRVPSPLVGLTPTQIAALADAPLPLVEETGDGHCLVTFCWQDRSGDAEGVLLFANRLTDETCLEDTLLEPLAGTDWWHATFRMESDWRASYAFLVHRRGQSAPWLSADQVQIRQVLDQGVCDPQNPAWCENRAGVRQSVVELPDAPPQPWTQPRAGASTGSVTGHRLTGERRVWCYQPAGVDSATPLPLLLVLDGEVWVQPSHSLPVLLDNLIADGVLGPVRAVLLDSGGRDRRWQELGTEGGGVADLVEGLVPWARQRFAVASGPANVAVAGQSLGGLTALRAGLLRSDVVGGVISHSASLWQDDLLGLVDPALCAGRPLPRIHLAHGRQEWVLTGPHQRLAECAQAAGLDLKVSQHNGGHDYAWWRGGVAEGLIWLWGIAD